MMLWAAPLVAATAVQLQVALVEDRAGARTVLAESRIDGPAGVDFDVDLRLDRLILVGHFTTDLADAGAALEIDARLESRRLHGRSERDLPLWEIDTQERTLRVGFDEAVVLLPFGRARADGPRIEIVPVATGAPAQPLRIDLVKPAPGGALRVTARKIPHRFVCAAALVAGGRELARGSAACRLGRAQPIALSDGSAAVVTVDSYTRDRPADAVSVRFDVDRAGAAVARGWAGATQLGEPMRYPLGGDTQLLLTVRLADGEAAD